MRRYDAALQAIARIEALGATTRDVDVQKAMILFQKERNDRGIAEGLADDQSRG